MKFQPNDKVVATVSNWDTTGCKVVGHVPKAGRVYVVERVLDVSVAPSLALVLVGSAVIAGGTEVGWEASGFEHLSAAQARNRKLAEFRQLRGDLE